MFIVQAIVRARTELIVYFLLSSWLDALDHDGRARAIPAKAKQLPIRGLRDVRQRLAAVREKIGQRSASSPSDMRSLEDAAAALSVACEQLRNLATEDEPTPADQPIRAALRS